MPFTIDNDRPDMFKIEPLSEKELSEEDLKTTNKMDLFIREWLQNNIDIDDIAFFLPNDLS